MVTPRPSLTAFGRWAEAQPFGALRVVECATGVAYSTVHEAKTRLVSKPVAILFARVSKRKRIGDFEFVQGYSFDAEEMTLPELADRRRQARRRPARRRRRAASAA